VTFAEQLLIGSSIAIAIGSLVVAAILWRRLSAVGRGLRTLESSLPARAEQLTAAVADGRSDLVRANAVAERATWIAASSDERLERARAGLAAQRAASDRLRRTLIANRANVVRVRDVARMRLRMIEMRRNYLG
jgi:hypothetical protein